MVWYAGDAEEEEDADASITLGLAPQESSNKVTMMIAAGRIWTFIDSDFMFYARCISQR